MAKVLSESELQNYLSQIYQQELLQVLEEKWSKLSDFDKSLVVEMLKSIYPEKAKLITESRWYNTVGDILGIFDPIGVVDLINGISYWRQGDKFFAILSWISVIPYFGDLIGKPVVGIMKAGGAVGKAFKGAAVAGDAAKVASISKRAGGPLAKMVTESPKWGAKVLELLKKGVNKIRFLGKPLVKTVEEFIGVFTKASKETGLPKTISKGGKIIDVESALTKSEKDTLLKQLEKEQGKMFSKHKGVKNSWLGYMKSDATLGEKLYAGAPRIFGGNPATRSLMRRTNVYAGFLDSLGLGNFVGSPEDLESQIPDAQKKWEEYYQSPEGQTLWNSEFGNVSGSAVPPPPMPTQKTPTKQTKLISNDVVTNIFTSLFTPGL